MAIRITNASVLIDTRKLAPIRSQSTYPNHKRKASVALMALTAASVALVLGIWIVGVAGG